jgi:mono/diheme cytochrome c family protein
MKKSSPLLALSLLLLAALAAHAQGPNTPRSQLISNGREQFRGWCTGCHGGYTPDDVNWLEEGKGAPGPSGTPPLANSDFFMASRSRAMTIVLDGYIDPITVNGMLYSGGHMPPWRESDLTDYDIASILTYIRAVLNDSTVTSCDGGNLNTEGFATCVKTPRSPTEIANDSIAVWEVTNARNGIVNVGGRASSSAASSRSFRVVGNSGSYAFAVPAGLSEKATLRVVDAWGRTVWSARVNTGDRTVRWNGALSNGRKAPAGLYLARFEGFRAR